MASRMSNRSDLTNNEDDDEILSATQSNTRATSPPPPASPAQHPQPQLPRQYRTNHCCFYLKYGVCEPPNGRSCRFDHVISNEMDTDGSVICCFGPTCRLGHSKRALSAVVGSIDETNRRDSIMIGDKPTSASKATPETTAATTNERLQQYWNGYNNRDDDGNAIDRFNNDNDKGGIYPNIVGDSPAVRDVTLLRSQLEPYSTAALRNRLVEYFQDSYEVLDGMARGEIMHRLLESYKEGGHLPRTKVYKQPPKQFELSKDLQKQVLTELKVWRYEYTGIGYTSSSSSGTIGTKVKNTRPSINAKTYMILRKPSSVSSTSKEETTSTKDGKDTNTSISSSSRLERMAERKLNKYRRLWNLATYLLQKYVRHVDREFVDHQFSALAVTYGFHGSPHIDKQNTTPFYGISFGSYVPHDECGGSDGAGGGELCVELDPFHVAYINTKNRFAKVDGRYVHWVSPYDTTKYDRYSLIYYSTHTAYQQPTKPIYYLDEEGEANDHTNGINFRDVSNALPVVADTVEDCQNTINRKNEAEEVLLKYLGEVEQHMHQRASMQPPPRVKCCGSSRSYYCSECCRLLLPSDDDNGICLPATIQNSTLHLPFDIDIILDEKERRTSASSVQLVSIFNTVNNEATRNMEQEHLQQTKQERSESGGGSTHCQIEPQDTIKTNKSREGTNVRLYDLGRDSCPTYNSINGSSRNSETGDAGVYLLFPSDDSVPITAVTEPIKKLVVLDCKWSKTSVVRLNPGIASLPKVHLANPPDKSLFWRWHNSGRGMLSTIEAIYYAAWEVSTQDLSMHQDRHNLVHAMWLFALQRAVITHRSREEQRIAPFSDEGKLQQRLRRQKQSQNPQPNPRTMELRRKANT